MKRDLQRIEVLNRQELEKLGLPTEVRELAAALGKRLPRDRKGRPRDQDVPETVKRGWSILQVLMAIPQTLRYASEGNAYLAARWALKTVLSGQYGAYATRGAKARLHTDKASRSDKYRRGIQAFVDEIVAKEPRTTVALLWNLCLDPHGAVGEYRVIGSDGRDYLIYRDGDKLVQVDNSTNESKSLERRSVQPYITRARRSLHSRRIDDTT